MHILLLNAKGGHPPTIKFLFAYVIGNPKPVVEPETLDLQEMQQLQQSALPPEALETLCGQLPFDFQVQLTRFSQAENVAAVAETAMDNEPGVAPPPSVPSTDRDNGESRGPAAVSAPSPNSDFRTPIF
jgi:hypothetical protein